MLTARFKKPSEEGIVIVMNLTADDLQAIKVLTDTIVEASEKRLSERIEASEKRVTEKLTAKINSAEKRLSDEIADLSTGTAAGFDEMQTKLNSLQESRSHVSHQQKDANWYKKRGQTLKT